MGDARAAGRRRGPPVGGLWFRFRVSTVDKKSNRRRRAPGARRALQFGAPIFKINIEYTVQITVPPARITSAEFYTAVKTKKSQFLIEIA